MNWSVILVVVVIFLFAAFLKPSTSLKEEVARKYLKEGALIVDVRTEAEYQSQHIPGVVNIPLDRVAVELPGRVRDKAQVVLLHCQSGRRSGVAEKELRRLGYQNAFNLGSFTRARKLLSDQAD